MTTRFVPNPHFDIIEDSTRGREMLQDTVDDIAAEAEHRAPYETGELAGDIEGDLIEDDDGKTIGRVTSFDFKGGWWEFGTALHAPKPYLGPAAIAIVGNLE